ncbi:hypothetical protein CLOSCI_02274 [[Clostridium] scindens ATCC 35704]|nr:hypothetical protein CLOSCI_02274 [[Clostridium] scindens ATCC 35704]
MYHGCIRQVYILFDKHLENLHNANGTRGLESWQFQEGAQGSGKPLRLSENSLNSLTKYFSMAMIFNSLYVKALKKRSMHKFVFERESGPEAERRLMTEMQKVAFEPDC